MKVSHYRKPQPGLLDLFFDDFATRSRFEQRPDHKHTNRRPAANVMEEEKAFKIEMLVPGFDKKDLNVEMNEDLLKVTGEIATNDEQQPEYKRREFKVKSFERSFRVNEDIDRDNISAQYENGVLHIVLPKDEQAKLERVRQIKVG